MTDETPAKSPTLRHLVLVLDRSGSMTEIREDTEGGVASFLADQRVVPIPTLVTLAQFDHQYELVQDRVPIEDVQGWDLEPRGFTALLDAIGRTVSHVREVDGQLEDDTRPDQTILVIVTDGKENASVEWKPASRVRELIQQVRADGWGVVYLGADADTFQDARDLGVDVNSSARYTKSATGTRSSWGATSEAVAAAASPGMSANSLAYTDAQREAMLAEDPADQTNG